MSSPFPSRSTIRDGHTGHSGQPAHAPQAPEQYASGNGPYAADSAVLGSPLNSQLLPNEQEGDSTPDLGGDFARQRFPGPLALASAEQIGNRRNALSEFEARRDRASNATTRPIPSQDPGVQDYREKTRAQDVSPPGEHGLQEKLGIVLL
ncbi:hypothetical protein NUW54_g926 [Trametes sanguinea]|uniref:Uncharacterized protein n=1 Tax=Trametes sanguinea TaxID=158606 RepID=A0ACC1Q8C5_9APHY|nr:hypothetical protein NUW54_g926 [Trametes sanguinea]